MPKKAVIIHEAGEDIFAKWPGSTLYYPAKVVGYDEELEVYKVQFENDADAAPAEVSSKHVWSVERAQSWKGNSGSPGRTPGSLRRRRRSRSRSRSPSRVPRQQRSPARKDTPISRRRKPSPADKSPETESPPAKQVESVVKVEPPRQDVDLTDSSPEKKEAAASTFTTEFSSVTKEEKALLVDKRVTRSVSRLQHLEKEVDQPTTTTTSLEQKTERPPAIGCRSQIEAVIWIALMPFIILGLCFVCYDKHQAFSFSKWPEIPAVRDLFEWKCFGAVGIWCVVQFLLTLVPIGEIYESAENREGERLKYRINGLLLLVLNIAAFGVLTYTKHAYKIANLVDENYLRIVTACILAAFVMGILAMIKGRLQNKTGCSPYGFLNGVQLNPRMCGIDFKVASTKAGISLWCSLNFCFLLKQYYSNKYELNYATAAVVAFQLLYLVVTWVNEQFFISSRDIVHESYGFGFAYLSLVMLPFFYSMQVLYLSKMTPTVTAAQWVATILFKVIGFYIYHQSNVEKLEFRSETKKSKKRDVKVVFTSDGRNLLADGWWGRLRHPNYLGDIMVAISWAIPAGCTHAVPWLYPVMLVLLLIYRAQEDEKYCAQKYGLSWDEYKARVKYIMFPYVY